MIEKNNRKQGPDSRLWDALSMTTFVSEVMRELSYRMDDSPEFSAEGLQGCYLILDQAAKNIQGVRDELQAADVEIGAA